MKASEHPHTQQIRDQFTKQAIPFTQLSGHSDSIQSLIEMSGVSVADEVLDVACGPGMVACEFARVASTVTGIDLTEAMLVQARKRQESLGLGNLHWVLGSADALPFADDRYSVVVTRYTFHHFLEPAAVLAEMCRVCRPGGRILIADPVLPALKVDAYNAMERLRDPSHTRALSVEQMEAMIQQAGLKQVQRIVYPVKMELEAQLAASFPNPGDAARIRRLFSDDIGQDRLGLDAHFEGEAIHFTYPISVYVGMVE